MIASRPSTCPASGPAMLPTTSACSTIMCVRISARTSRWRTSTFADIDRLHRKITKAGLPHRANRVVAVLSKMFSLAIRWAMRTDNPAKGIERNIEIKRKRYLCGDELARLTQALAAHPDKQAANIVRLLLLTGARRGEVLAISGPILISAPARGRSRRASTKQKDRS